MKHPTLKELSDMATELYDMVEIADRLPANSCKHMALIVSLHQAKALADAVCVDAANSLA